jgi:hypothetical protein
MIWKSSKGSRQHVLLRRNRESFHRLRTDDVRRARIAKSKKVKKKDKAKLSFEDDEEPVTAPAKRSLEGNEGALSSNSSRIA